jgi:hypothetical protein
MPETGLAAKQPAVPGGQRCSQEARQGGGHNAGRCSCRRRNSSGLPLLLWASSQRGHQCRHLQDLLQPRQLLLPVKLLLLLLLSTNVGCCQRFPTRCICAACCSLSLLLLLLLLLLLKSLERSSQLSQQLLCSGQVLLCTAVSRSVQAGSYPTLDLLLLWLLLLRLL